MKTQLFLPNNWTLSWLDTHRGQSFPKPRSSLAAKYIFRYWKIGNFDIFAEIMSNKRWVGYYVFPMQFNQLTWIVVDPVAVSLEHPMVEKEMQIHFQTSHRWEKNVQNHVVTCFLDICHTSITWLQLTSDNFCDVNSLERMKDPFQWLIYHYEVHLDSLINGEYVMLMFWIP